MNSWECPQLGQNLLWCYEQHSRRFSSQTRSQQHRRPQSIQVRGWSRRQRQDLTDSFHRWDHTFFVCSTSTTELVLISKSSPRCVSRLRHVNSHAFWEFLPGGWQEKLQRMFGVQCRSESCFRKTSSKLFWVFLESFLSLIEIYVLWYDHLTD